VVSTSIRRPKLPLLGFGFGLRSLISISVSIIWLGLGLSLESLVSFKITGNISPGVAAAVSPQNWQDAGCVVELRYATLIELTAQIASRTTSDRSDSVASASRPAVITGGRVYGLGVVYEPRTSSRPRMPTLEGFRDGPPPQCVGFPTNCYIHDVIQRSISRGISSGRRDATVETVLTTNDDET